MTLKISMIVRLRYIFILVMVKLKADKKEEKKEEKTSDRKIESNNVKVNTKERINDIFDFEKDITEKESNIGSVIVKNNGRISDKLQNPIQNFGSPNKIKSYNDPLETMKNDLIIENKYKEKDKLKPNTLSIGDFIQSIEPQISKDSKDTSLFGKN